MTELEGLAADIRMSFPMARVVTWPARPGRPEHMSLGWGSHKVTIDWDPARGFALLREGTSFPELFATRAQVYEHVVALMMAVP